jgi:hypothetical protein
VYSRTGSPPDVLLPQPAVASPPPQPPAPPALPSTPSPSMTTLSSGETGSTVAPADGPLQYDAISPGSPQTYPPIPPKSAVDALSGHAGSAG